MSAVITIDVEYGDRPSAEPLRTLDRILEVLDAHAVPATFFVQGRWARAHPELTFWLTRVGTGIAGHDEHRVAALFAGAPANVVRPRGW